MPSRRYLVKDNFAVNDQLGIVNPIRNTLVSVLRVGNPNSSEIQDNLPVRSGFGDYFHTAEMRLNHVADLVLRQPPCFSYLGLFIGDADDIKITLAFRFQLKIDASRNIRQKLFVNRLDALLRRRDYFNFARMR